MAKFGGVRVDTVDAGEDSTTLIACGGGRYALHTLIWRARSLLSFRVKVATLITFGMLRVTWSDSLSSSSLLVMFGARQHYVVAIISGHREVIRCVPCGRGMTAAYFF